MVAKSDFRCRLVGRIYRTRRPAVHAQLPSNLRFSGADLCESLTLGRLASCGGARQRLVDHGTRVLAIKLTTWATFLAMLQLTRPLHAHA